MILFTKALDVLKVPKVVLQILLFIVMQKSKLIHTILCLSITFHNVTMTTTIIYF